MRTFDGVMTETQLLAGERAGWIACPLEYAPAPGQYLLGCARTVDEALAVPLFASGLAAARDEAGFLAAPPLPPAWLPGQILSLRGPLGRGFHLPGGVRRVALAALGDSFARLLPLARLALEQDAAVTLLGDCALPALPASLEAYPFAALAEALTWADYLALDLPLEALPDLRERLGLAPYAALPCQAQALLFTPMPCGGLAECGVCAAPARRGWKLACKDGPVFDLDEVDW
jgi:hypothetical protein